jgi:hypothetical protein
VIGTSRPPETQSTLATALAVAIGSRWTTCRMPVPIFRSVVASAADRERHKDVEPALVARRQVAVPARIRRLARRRDARVLAETSSLTPALSTIREIVAGSTEKSEHVVVIPISTANSSHVRDPARPRTA